MEWFHLPTDGFEAFFFTPTERVAADRLARPTTRIDTMLIEVAYTVMVSESTCGRCGAPLSSSIELVPEDPRRQPVLMVVRTRCCGWRRHRQVAVVSRPGRDLLVGPFESRRIRKNVDRRRTKRSES